MKGKHLIILVVLSIALLVGSIITWPKLDSHGYWLGTSRARMEIIGKCVDAFYTSKGRLPSDQENLEILSRESAFLNKQPCLTVEPNDYWGNRFIYQKIDEGDKTYNLYSPGPDGVDNQGMGDDVVTWEKEYDCELFNDCPTIKDRLNTFFMISFAVSLVLLMAWSVLYLIKIIKKNG